VSYVDGDGTRRREYIFADNFKSAYNIVVNIYGDKNMRGVVQTNFDFKDERPQR